MSFVIRDGDMSGKILVRGQGQGGGTYNAPGYIDHKGRISDGRIRDLFNCDMAGKIADGAAKSKFFGSECRGN